jgi:hypothetical protein
MKNVDCSDIWHVMLFHMPNLFSSFSKFSLPFAQSLPPFTPLSSSVALSPLRDFFGHRLSRHYHIGSLTYKRRADSWLLLHMAFRRCCSGLLFRCHLRIWHPSQRVRLKTSLGVKAPTPSGI